MKWCMLDLETTGLDERTCTILEASAQIVDPSTLYLFPGQCVDKIVAYPEMPEMEPGAEALHRASGLYDEVYFGTTPVVHRNHHRFPEYAQGLKDLDDCLSLLFGEVAEQGELYLAGNSVHFDKAFLKVHCPKAHAWLSHRVVDLSTIRAMRKAWLEPELQKSTAAHRAKADWQMSLEELRWAKGLFTKQGV